MTSSLNGNALSSRCLRLPATVIRAALLAAGSLLAWSAVAGERVDFAQWQAGSWDVCREPGAAQPGTWIQEKDRLRAGEKEAGFLNLLYRPVNSADVTVESDMAFAGDGAPSLILRAQIKGDMVGDVYSVVLYKKGLNLWRRVDGRSTKVAQAFFTPEPGKLHRVRATAEGWRLRVWVDGTPMVDVEDATIPMAGRVGLWAGEGLCEFRDFSVEAKAPPSAGREPPAWQVAGAGQAEEAAWSTLAGAAGGKLTWGNNSSEQRLDTVDGAVRIAARSNADKANHYIGMLLPVPVRDLRQRQLVLDVRSSTPEAASTLYVRLYDAAGHRVASWIGHPHLSASTPVTLRLPVGSGGSEFVWEPKGLQGEPAAVTALEVLVGTARTNATLDLSASNLRTAPLPTSVQHIEKVKPLFLETRLVADGKPVALIVAPERFAALALALQARIRELTGVTVPVLADAALADAQGCWNTDGIARRSGSIIAFGNLELNRLLPLLYARFYTAVDAYFPGQGGHALHTVHDPWGNGHNMVVVGGSDEAGVRAAADALLAELAKQPAAKKLSLPRLTQFQLSAGLLKQLPALGRHPDGKPIARSVTKAREAFARGQHTGITLDLYQAGFNYAHSGHEGYAELFKQLARLMIEIYRSKPATYGGPWGMDADFNSMQVIAAWDLVEESPAFTEAERLELTRIIAEYAAYYGEFGNVLGASRPHVRNNHNTFPCLGVLFAAEYFGKYYHVAEAARWLAATDACFQAQALSFKPQEDSNGYQWLTVGHLMRYALARPDHSYFANGNARRTLDLAVATMDSLGFQSAFGDVGGWRGWASEVPLWNIGTWYFGDPTYRWAIERERPVQPSARIALGGYETTHPPAGAPTGFDGTHMFPMERRFFDYWAPHATNDTEKLWLAPVEQTYEKVSFRGSFDERAPYLLLDGIGCGGHRHYDGNALVRYSDRGREWFADGDYIKALPKFHTSVLVFHDGQSSTLPPFCALEAHADLPGAGLVRSTVRDYGDADWSRNLVWLKGGCFVAIDALKARAAGEYSFRTVWHTLGEPRIEGQRYSLEQNGERFVLDNLDGARLKLTDDEALGKNWVGYTNAAPVDRVLQQIAGRTLQAGESHHFLNVFGAVNGAPVKAGRASDTSLLVTVKGGTSLVGVTEGKRAAIAPGIETDAAIYVLRPRGFALAKATLLVADGRTLFKSDVPVNIECDGNTARAVVEAHSRVNVELFAQAAQALAPGRQELALGAVPSLTLFTLPPEAPAVANVSAKAAAVPALPVRWTFGGGFTCLATADLDGDQRAETIAGGADGRVCCIGADGKLRWEFKASKAINTVWAGVLDGGRRGVVVAGSADGKAYLLDASGQLLWEHAFPYYKRSPAVAVVFAADLDGSGKKAIIAGTESWHFYALDRSGRELWSYESVHGSTCGTAADLDGQGKQSVIAGTEYYWWHAIAPDGKRRWNYTTKSGPHANCVAAGALNNGGPRAVVFGGADGNLHVLGADGKPLWQFNTGDEVTGVAVADGRVFATSMSLNLYALDGQGRLLWRRDLGNVPRALALLPAQTGTRPGIAVGGEDGRIAVYDADGTLQAETKLAGAVTHLNAADLDGQGRLELVAIAPAGVIALGQGPY